MKNIETKPEELERLFVRTAGELAESLSMNRVVGQIYALLYISPEPVSMDDMVGKLGISKGSVSVNIRILEEWNAVKKIWVQGSRKDYYTAESDFLKIAVGRVHQGFSRRLTFVDERMNQMKNLISEKSNQGKDGELKQFYQERIKQLMETRDLMASLLTLLPRIESFKKLKMISSVLR